MNKYLIIGAIGVVVLAFCLYFYKQAKVKQVQVKPIKQVQIKPINLPKLENYKNEPSGVSVMLCYANWCSHCVEVKEWYIDLIKNSPLPNVTFEMCEEQDLPPKVLNSIPGFPSIVIFVNGQMQRYPGDRTKEDLLRYLKNI